MQITKRGVFLLLEIFCDVVWRPGISITEQLLESMNPRFRFIMVIIIIYLFVLDDLLVVIEMPQEPNNELNVV